MTLSKPLGATDVKERLRSHFKMLNCRPDDGNSVVDNSAYTCVIPPSAAKSMPVM
jgi:hypothetical protein